MVSRREWAWVAALSAPTLFLINLPYLLAYANSDAGHIFTGIMYALADGHSYLAKIRQGWRGEWLFTLAYTAEPGPGVFLFTYYLFLGHLARWLGLSVETIYHGARLVNGALFLMSAFHFIAHFFETARARLLAWLFFTWSSGLSWVTALTGTLAPDAWIAESLPFLTLFSNAHFPLAWALMLWIFEWSLPGLAQTRPLAQRLALIGFATTALGLVQPMTFVTIGAVLGGLWLARAALLRSLLYIMQEAAPILVLGVCAAPWVVYALWVVQDHPVMRLWNAQNVTPSPPWNEALLWAGVPFALALVGAARAARRRSLLDQSLLAWLVLGSLIVYAPLALQRRLSMGLWTPVAILAAQGFRELIWPRVAARWRPLALAFVLLAVLPNAALILAGGVGGALARPPELFYSRAEAAALDWLAANARGAVVLAGPEMGAFIPGRADVRVVYGHPYETVNAPATQQAVLDFFAGHVAPERFFAEHPARFIFYGPREKKLGAPAARDKWRVVFQQDDVTLYER
jgi:hypothetical protein